MTDRLVDVTAVLVTAALLWLFVTRLGVVFGPDACWTTC